MRRSGGRDRGEVERFATADGRAVYRLPLEVFPGFWGNAYLVTGGARPILVDCGSGQPASDADLVAGLTAVGERFGEAVGWSDLGAVVVTHGHIDHFGGLGPLRRRTAAPVLVPRIDRRVVTHYPERLAMAARQVDRFLATTGIGDERRAAHLATYRFSKSFFVAQPVDAAYEAGALLDGELEAIAAPGHCPGQHCLRLGDVLLTADHLLARITPHLSPEAITPATGVAHYLESLAAVGRLEGVGVGLGGHGPAMPDVAARALEIRRAVAERQARVRELCAEPRTIDELSRQVFGPVRSYHVLLALLETGAHVEHLYHRGDLAVAEPESAAPPRYVAL